MLSQYIPYPNFYLSWVLCHDSPNIIPSNLLLLISPNIIPSLFHDSPMIIPSNIPIFVSPFFQVPLLRSPRRLGRNDGQNWGDAVRMPGMFDTTSGWWSSHHGNHLWKSSMEIIEKTWKPSSLQFNHRLLWLLLQESI